MSPVIRLTSRASRLALAQVALATADLRQVHHELQTEVVEITTEGDRDQSSPLTAIGGRGVFVAGVREALLDGRGDVAVHSLKDVPAAPVPGLRLTAFLERADPRDAFVGSEGRRLAQLPAGARLSTSPTRRVEMLRTLRPDLEIAEIRGNVDTRLRKVSEDDYDGAILAAAGLERLGRIGEATQIFEAAEFLPAPGQGVVALECREDDARTIAVLEAVDHESTRHAVTAERAFLARLGAGCDLPVGAFAQVDGDLITLRAMLGGTGGTPLFGDATGQVSDAEAIGRGIAEQLLASHPDPPATPA
jgi:hydroxymethylbilane synthase